MKRTFKFYRKNEAEVMESLGLKPTINSGSTWIEKEDGQNDYVICQLKSTDAQSIKINQKDLRVLEINAGTAHKYPLFAIQFLNNNETWLLAKPEDFAEIAKYIETGKTNRPPSMFVEGVRDLDEEYAKQCEKERKISSSEDARNEFYKLKNQKYEKKRSAK